MTFCEKPERVVKIITLDAIDTLISYTTATLKGEIIDLGSQTIEDHGILVSENAIPIHTNSDIKTLGIINSKGIFQAQFTNLTFNTTYYFRSFVTVNSNISYGEIKQFKTKDYNLPTVITFTLSIITNISAVSGGNVTADGENAVTARGVCWSTTANPTITNSITTNGAGTGTFTSYLLGLNANTTYYVRAYATNIKGTGYGNELAFTTKDGSGIYDIEGNIYHTIDIGTQTWMVENLKTTKYNDGTPIPLVTDQESWVTYDTPGYCWNNNDIGYKDPYGALYNYYAVNTTSNGGKNICPVSWHVPTDEEWTNLTDYLINNGFGYGGSGSKIAKSMAATSGWVSSTIPGNVGNDQASNNISGFSAFSGGCRTSAFLPVLSEAYWWSSNNNTYRHMSALSGYVDSAGSDQHAGYSVRCIKD
jgi:uncharacterized protein (TIGR02145 family)